MARPSALPGDRPDLDPPDPDLGPFGLQLDLAESVRAVGPAVHDLAVDDVGDGVAVADHFLAIPFAGRDLDVLAAAEAEDVLPLRIAAVPVEAAAVARDGLAALL